ncbi:MAG: LLM class flavin-dependent oxidoreductase [Acidimicrobiaceae bacterium]|nr:LLM class flavin-dependent oxidoreductase [Acidimicrobiaceae bacterium]
MPIRMGSNELPDARQVQQNARLIEAAGLDGIWSLDMLGAAQVQPRPDPLTWLLTACLATEHVEVGTAVYNTALRHPVDVAQRLLTIEALVPGRLSLGVGAGSTGSADEAMGVTFESRFRRFYANMDVLRRLCSGEHVVDHAHGATGEAFFNPPPASPGPRFYLGAWHSRVTMAHAVKEYDGWLCSAGYLRHLPEHQREAGPGTLANVEKAIRLYQDMGGSGRKILSTISWDFGARSGRLGDDETFNLACPPAEAAERLHAIAELGFDDILLMQAGQSGAPTDNSRGLLEEQLGQLRTLLPEDRRPVGRAG